MAKRDRDKEYWRAQKEERVQRESARKYRARILRVLQRKPDRAQAGKPDLHGLIAKAQSTDEAGEPRFREGDGFPPSRRRGPGPGRAQAVRSLCPCRIGWDGFQQGMEVVDRMRKDRSPEVRRQALHVFDDAYGMQAMETRKADREVDEVRKSEAVERARQGERRAKRETTVAFGRRHRPR